MKSFSTPTKTQLKRYQDQINAPQECAAFHPTLDATQFLGPNAVPVTPEIVLAHYMDRLYKVFASYSMFRANGEARELTMSMDQALMLSRHYGICPALLSHNEVKTLFMNAAKREDGGMNDEVKQSGTNLSGMTPKRSIAQRLNFDNARNELTTPKQAGHGSRPLSAHVTSRKEPLELPSQPRTQSVPLLTFPDFLSLLTSIARSSKLLASTFSRIQSTTSEQVSRGHSESVFEAIAEQLIKHNIQSKFTGCVEQHMTARQLELLLYLMDEAIVNRAKSSIQSATPSRTFRSTLDRRSGQSSATESIEMLKARRFSQGELSSVTTDGTSNQVRSDSDRKSGSSSLTSGAWLGAPRLHWVGFLTRTITDADRTELEDYKQQAAAKEQEIADAKAAIAKAELALSSKKARELLRSARKQQGYSRTVGINWDIDDEEDASTMPMISSPELNDDDEHSISALRVSHGSSVDPDIARILYLADQQAANARRRQRHAITSMLKPPQEADLIMTNYPNSSTPGGVVPSSMIMISNTAEGARLAVPSDGVVNPNSVNPKLMATERRVDPDSHPGASILLPQHAAEFQTPEPARGTSLYEPQGSDPMMVMESTSSSGQFVTIKPYHPLGPIRQLPVHLRATYLKYYVASAVDTCLDPYPKGPFSRP